MKIIRFREADCKNCYKCLRSCPVKAISFTGDSQAHIDESQCILCGNCLSVCPQNAKIVRNDVDKVRQWISKKEKVYVSLAPSYVSAFADVELAGMISLLKTLGFTHVEETALGASLVSGQYARLIEENRHRNLITTACPTVVALVEKYYPDLLDSLAPVVSPMIAHARMLRATFGPRIRVVFIGPCLSKKEEASDVIHAGAVDAVLTFEELDSWIRTEDVTFPSEPEPNRTSNPLTARLYPAPGGILKTLDKRERRQYSCLSIDGMDRCRVILESLRSGQQERYFIEMNACAGSCLEGPCKPRTDGGYLKSRERLIATWKGRTGSVEPSPGEETLRTGTESVCVTGRTPRVQLARKFSNRHKPLPQPSEEVVAGILHSIGKYSQEKELNCGACGYPTCREKAVAVFLGKAQLTMCLPYMQERAASMSNLILNTTPNAILALNTEGIIQEMNQSARTLLQTTEREVVGKPVYGLLESAELALVMDEGKDVHNQRVRYEAYHLTVEQTVVFVPEQHLVVMILRNVTQEEEEAVARRRVRQEMVDIAQEVIEKQMRVAQEIASLLGETTAETKVALTQLKKSILPEGGTSS